MKYIIVLSLLALVVTSLMSYAANRKTERQQYQTIKWMDGFEIRFYPKAVMATVKSDGDSYMSNSNNDFRALAGYIFGGNKSSAKIAMTAPVHIEKDSGFNKMSFVMPSSYKMGDLPTPQNQNIELHYGGEGYFAALKFGGFASEHKIRKHIDELKAMLHKASYETIGNISYLGYNAPWELIGRENEVIVQVKY